jgi:hypothetical protein
MLARVECRSDHAYIGYPVAFYWQGARVEVYEILVENRNPQGYSFQVSTKNLGSFALNYDIITDEWSVEQL